jgi:hypothetical protein
MELEPNRKLYGDHLPSILDSALVGAGLRIKFWPELGTNLWVTIADQPK